jgi:hypothetical protein
VLKHFQERMPYGLFVLDIPCRSCNSSAHAAAFVCAMIGLFLLFAAINSRSSEAKGFAGALGVIQEQPYGSALLGITAAGLLAFGLYGIAEAAYRRISPP